MQNFVEFRPLKADLLLGQGSSSGLILIGVSEKFACVVY